MADQETHGLTGATLQGRGGIEAGDGRPDAVTPAEAQPLLGGEVHGIGDEAAASPGEFGGARGWSHIGQGEEAAAGDVVHQVPAEASGGISEAVLALLLAGMEQDPHRFDRGGAEHHQGGAHQVPPATHPINDHHPFRPALARRQHQMAHHRLAAQLNAAGGHSPRQGVSLRTGGGPGCRIGGAVQSETAGMDQGEPQLAADRAAQVFFSRREGQGVAVVTIGQLGQTIGLAVDPEQSFQAGVVRVEVCRADRPGRPMAIPGAGLELRLGEAQGDASPGEAAAAHLAPSGPEKGRIGRGAPGIAALIHEQVGIVLPEPRMLGLAPLAAAAEVRQALQGVAGFAAQGPCRGELRARLQHKHLQTSLRQHHGRHPAGGPGANHHGIGAGASHLRAVRSPIRLLSAGLHGSATPPDVAEQLARPAARSIVAPQLQTEHRGGQGPATATHGSDQMERHGNGQQEPGREMEGIGQRGGGMVHQEFAFHLQATAHRQKQSQQGQAVGKAPQPTGPEGEGVGHEQQQNQGQQQTNATMPFDPLAIEREGKAPPATIEASQQEQAGDPADGHQHSRGPMQHPEQ